MWKTKRRFYIVSALLILAAFLAPILIRWRNTAPSKRYQGYEAPTPIMDEAPALAQPVPLPETRTDMGTGTVLFDMAHANHFLREDVPDLVAKINDRGHRVAYLEHANLMEQQLRGADAFVIIAARRSYPAEELRILQRFVARGGRLVLIADPTLNEDIKYINSVANPFGVVYQDDYVYNVVDNAGNFRDVMFHDFADTALVDGVEAVVFFTAHPIRVASGGFVFGDENTFASKSEQPGNVVAAALPAAANGQVLALPDMTFLTSPYNSFADNNRFIDNICDWLVTAPRTYLLTDYPHFLAAGSEAHVVFADTFLANANIADVLLLRDTLADQGVDLNIRDSVQPDLPVITIALYDDIDPALANLLQDDGIAITDALEPIPPGTDPADVVNAAPSAMPADTPSRRFAEGQVYLAGVGTFEREDTSFFHLHRAGDRYHLVMLASDQEALTNGLNTLIGANLDRCALTDHTALCRGAQGIAPPAAPTAVPAPAGPPEAASVPSVLIVGDDDASDGDVTGAFAIAEILESHYKATVWSEKEFGSPLLEEMQSHDVVIWTTGAFVEGIPTAADADLLMAYVEGGGRLFLTGAHIGAAWGGTDFYREVAQAEHLGEGALTALGVAEAGAAHPIADGLAAGEIIELDAPLETDVIEPVAPAQALFVRCGESDEPGRAVILAGETDEGRQVYAALPITRLPAEARETLVLNIVAWLLE